MRNVSPINIHSKFQVNNRISNPVIRNSGDKTNHVIRNSGDKSHFNKSNIFEGETQFHQLEVSYEAAKNQNPQIHIIPDIYESQGGLPKQELQDRVVLLVTENERLNRLLQERGEDLGQQRTQSQQLKQQQDDKLRILEQKISKLIYENERVVILNEGLTQQINHLQNDFEMIREKSKADNEQIQAHWRKYYEKIQFDKQILDQANQSETIEKFEGLHHEIDKLRREHQIKDQIMDQQKQKKSQYDMEIQKYKEQNIRYEDKNNQLQNQLNSLILESEKTNQLLEIKVNESNRIRLDMEQKRIKLQDAISKDKLLEKTIQQYQQQLQTYQIKLHQWSEEKNGQNQDLIRANQDMSRLNQQYCELQELNQNTQVELQNQYRTTQEYHSYTQQLVHIEQKHNNLQKQYDELQQRENTLHQQLQAEIDLSHKKDIKSEQVMRENKTINMQLQQNTNEIELWKQKYSTLSKETIIKLQQTTSSYEIKLQETAASINRQIGINLQARDSEITSLNDRITLLLNQVDHLTREGRRNKDASTEVNSEVDHLRSREHVLTVEVDRLRQQGVAMEEESEKLRQQIVKLQSNYELQHEEDCARLQEMQQQVQSHREELIMKKREMVSMKQVLDEYTLNLNQVSQLLQESHNQTKQLQQQYQLCEMEIHELRQFKEQMGSMKLTHRHELEHLKKQFEQAIVLKTEKEVSQEREKWSKTVSMNFNESQKLKNQIDTLFSENELLRQDIVLFQSKFRQLELDNDTQKKQMTQLFQSKQKYKQYAKDLESNMKEQNNQSQHIMGLTEQQQLTFNQTINTLNQRYKQLQDENNTLNQRYKQLQDENSTLNEKLYIQETQFISAQRGRDDEIAILKKELQLTGDEVNNHQQRRPTPSRRGDENNLPSQQRVCCVKRPLSTDVLQQYDFERTNRMMFYYQM